jgi:hypothetical protein
LFSRDLAGEGCAVFCQSGGFIHLAAPIWRIKNQAAA